MREFAENLRKTMMYRGLTPSPPFVINKDVWNLMVQMQKEQDDKKEKERAELCSLLTRFVRR